MKVELFKNITKIQIATEIIIIRNDYHLYKKSFLIEKYY